MKPFIFWKSGKKYFHHNVKINYQAGCVYKWMNNLERAGERLERSLELGGIKYYPSIYQTLGYVYAGMGHCDRAEEFFKKALELKPDVQSYTGHGPYSPHCRWCRKSFLLL